MCNWLEALGGVFFGLGLIYITYMVLYYEVEGYCKVKKWLTKKVCRLFGTKD